MFRIKSIEYFENGNVKKIEYYDALPITIPPSSTSPPITFPPVIPPFTWPTVPPIISIGPGINVFSKIPEEIQVII